MLLTIYFCDEVVDNVCQHYVSFSEYFTIADTQSILTSMIAVWVLAWVVRMILKLFE